MTLGSRGGRIAALVVACAVMFGSGFVIGLSINPDGERLDWFWTWMYPVWPIIMTQFALTGSQWMVMSWTRRARLW